jgi:hypothetical protein
VSQTAYIKPNFSQTALAIWICHSGEIFGILSRLDAKSQRFHICFVDIQFFLIESPGKDIYAGNDAPEIFELKPGLNSGSDKAYTADIFRNETFGRNSSCGCGQHLCQKLLVEQDG